MGRQRVHGICRICKAQGRLSFEHVPPRGAFNDRTVLAYSLEQIYKFNPLEPMRERGRAQQRGSGAYTLCNRCNNDTGSWYVPAFTEWVHQSAEIVGRYITRGVVPNVAFPQRIYPLRVFKQIIVMMFSNAADGHLSQHHEALTRFVLNRESSEIPDDVRLFVHFMTSPILRRHGLVGQIDLKRNRAHFFWEITFPPFGYLLTVDSEPPDDRLQEITYFRNYNYHRCAEVWLRTPLLDVATWQPADYRSRDEFARDLARDLAPSQEDGV